MTSVAAGRRPLSFGLNYLPSIELIEHFAPFWIDNRMTVERTRCDLLSMRAMNARFVRFHIMPANPARDCHPGEVPEKSVAIIEQAVRFAKRLGLHVHYDIWSNDRMKITEDEVVATVTKFRGLVDSYQIGNEQYHSWEDRHCRHVEKLVAAGKAADPSVRWGLDMFPADLARVRKDFPRLYSLLDVALIHFYAISGIGGWEPVYLEQMVWHCGGKDNRFEEMKGWRFVQSEFYAGEYGQFDKERWITEITACGYHRYAAHVNEDVKAANWEQVSAAVAGRTDVTVVGHHSFRDKMSWREIGTSQCGMVWLDGRPKPSGLAFARMAEKSLPADDLARWVKVTLEAGKDEVTAHLANTSDKPIAGKFWLAGGEGVEVGGQEIPLVLPPGETVTHRAEVRFHKTRQAAWHVFGVFEAAQWPDAAKAVVGWAWPTRPAEILLNEKYPPLRGVNYVGGVAAVTDFFRLYPNPAIVTGDLIGFEAEMAYRLRSVLQGVGGEMLDQAATLTASRVLDRPLVVIGNAANNYLARAIELLAKPDCKVSERNRCFLAVIEEPFQAKTRGSAVANAVGQAFSPACLYIAGIDQAAIQRASYDLIRRLWVDESVKVDDPIGGRNPLVGQEPATFRVDLDEGPYRLTVMMGQVGGVNATQLKFNDSQDGGVFWTEQMTKTQTFNVVVEKDHLLVNFCSPKGQSWAVWGMELAHAGLLAEYRNFIFTSKPEAEIRTRNIAVVTAESKYVASRGFGWV